AELKTPEGYPVQFAGPTSGAYDIYIQVSASRYEHFVDSTSAPSDWSSSNRTVQSFLASRQETYDGRVAVDMDPDFDDITTPAENACGMNPNSDDTDGDGIRDGVEYRGCADFDADSKPDANDTDADGDGILDNLEDKDLNGKLDAGETDARGTDTDGDGIGDGTEDADLDGTRDATETSPIDRDTDDDGIGDYAEVHGTWCYVGETTGCGGETSARYLTPTSVDTDGDGIRDGVEIGLTSPGKDTLASAFVGDANPSTTTNPKVVDTDTDAVWDGNEDLNKNGRVDSGEADPKAWDTDYDGLPDGRVDFDPTSGTLWKGEDLNNNGVRDQDAEGEWNETDFLANNSDVDGVLDSLEVNGTYCFKGGSCANTAHPLLPLNADSDGDQLRDGQELAGWVIGIWYERTMEKKENRSVTSNPWSGQTDSDSDGMTDFEEFMNGSDPTLWDTDGDGITDPDEIARKSNITGIEGTPPQIANVSLQVGIDWDWWGFLYLPLRSHVTVSFDVSDNVGVGRVDVKFIRYSGTTSVHLEWTQAAAPLNYHFSHRFDFSIAEALVAGADVNITAFDVNENGAWGDFHIKSILEAIADAIAAFLSAIAKVIMEAASAAINWIWGMIRGAFDAIFAGVSGAIDFLMGGIKRALEYLQNLNPADGLDPVEIADQLIVGVIDNPLLELLYVILLVINVVLLLTLPVTSLFFFVVPIIAGFLAGILITALIGTAAKAIGGWVSDLIDGEFDVGQLWAKFVPMIFPSAARTRADCTVQNVLFAFTVSLIEITGFFAVRYYLKVTKVLASNALVERTLGSDVTLSEAKKSGEFSSNVLKKLEKKLAALKGRYDKLIDDKSKGLAEVIVGFIIFGLGGLLPLPGPLNIVLAVVGFFVTLNGVLKFKDEAWKRSKEREDAAAGLARDLADLAPNTKILHTIEKVFVYGTLVGEVVGLPLIARDDITQC
ncbi:MAG TPA: hypothetical protein VJ547_11265, partial [Candidatus Thermoplasmatota archaeon]|nr:hypothetical protein [Candidatus Thermoplasmatota archaeon]